MEPHAIIFLRQLQSKVLVRQPTCTFIISITGTKASSRLIRNAEFNYKCEPKLDVYLKAFFGEVVVRAKKQILGKC